MLLLTKQLTIAILSSNMAIQCNRSGQGTNRRQKFSVVTLFLYFAKAYIYIETAHKNL